MSCGQLFCVSYILFFFICVSAFYLFYIRVGYFKLLFKTLFGRSLSWRLDYRSSCRVVNCCDSILWLKICRTKAFTPSKLLFQIGKWQFGNWLKISSIPSCRHNDFSGVYNIGINSCLFIYCLGVIFEARFFSTLLKLRLE